MPGAGDMRRGSPGGTYYGSGVRGHVPGAGDVRGVVQGVLTMVPGLEVTYQEQEMLGGGVVQGVLTMVPGLEVTYLEQEMLGG